MLGGEDSVTMTRMPYLVERAMVTVLRACIHMFDREDMGVRKLLCYLPNLSYFLVAVISLRLGALIRKLSRYCNCIVSGPYSGLNFEGMFRSCLVVWWYTCTMDVPTFAAMHTLTERFFSRFS